MKTAIVDDKHRIRIPSFKPGQVLAYQDNGNGTVTLTPVKPDIKEPFPRGSLKHLCTAGRNKELEQIAKATIIGVPKDYAK